MNYMSRPCNDKCNPCNDNTKKEKNCNTIIKCGFPSSTTLPLVTISGDFTIASLNLDTSGLKNPCVKLDFTTNLVTVGAAITGTLTLRVYKQCANQLNPIPIGSSFIFGPISAGAEPLSFFVCDCDCSCGDECCNYSVVVTSTVTAGSISFNNSTLAAIATCGSSC